MKSIMHILAGFAILFLVGFTGCATDNPSPSPGDPREVYLGTWSVVEQETKGTYEVTIVLDASSSTMVKINNFANAGSSGNPAIAEVSGTNITLVPDQVIGDGWIINGGGSLTTSTKMNWGYTLNDGATLHNLTAVYTKHKGSSGFYGSFRPTPCQGSIASRAFSSAITFSYNACTSPDPIDSISDLRQTGHRRSRTF